MKQSRQKIEAALTQLRTEAKAGGRSERITIEALASRADVDRTLLYKTYPDIVARVNSQNKADAAQSEILRLLRRIGILDERLEKRERECAALGRLFVEHYHRSKAELKTMQEKLDEARRQRDELRRK